MVAFQWHLFQLELQASDWTRLVLQYVSDKDLCQKIHAVKGLSAMLNNNAECSGCVRAQHGFVALLDQIVFVAQGFTRRRTLKPDSISPKMDFTISVNLKLDLVAWPRGLVSFPGFKNNYPSCGKQRVI